MYEVQNWDSIHNSGYPQDTADQSERHRPNPCKIWRGI